MCRQIAAQTNLFMLAGYETTAVAITYCIYLVSKHPQVQQKLLQEVEKFKGKPTYEQLVQFPYAAAVISEALRLLPPGSVTSRQATADTQVNFPIFSHGAKKATPGITACQMVWLIFLASSCWLWLLLTWCLQCLVKSAEHETTEVSMLTFAFAFSFGSLLYAKEWQPKSALLTLQPACLMWTTDVHAVLALSAIATCNYTMKESQSQHALACNLWSDMEQFECLCSLGHFTLSRVQSYTSASTPCTGISAGDRTPYKYHTAAGQLHLSFQISGHERLTHLLLQLGAFHIPKGTVIHISIYAMHRDERWWQDAEQFKPERWVGDKTGGDKSGGLAYLPFGAGPRMCIGYKLACKCDTGIHSLMHHAANGSKGHLRVCMAWHSTTQGVSRRGRRSVYLLLREGPCMCISILYQCTSMSDTHGTCYV